MITLIYFSSTLNQNMTFSFDYRMIAGLLLTLLLPVVLYHNDKVYNVKDAFYLLGGVFFIGFSMSLFYMYRSIGLDMIILTEKCPWSEYCHGPGLSAEEHTLHRY